MSITIKSNVNATIDEVNRRIDMALEACGLKAEGYAKLELETAPRRIDTGLLRNSITHGLDGNSTAITSYSADKPSKYNGETPPPGNYSGTLPDEQNKDHTSVFIGTNVEYAPYVHEGFKLPSGANVPPNRFLKKAIERHTAEYKAIMEHFLSD